MNRKLWVEMTPEEQSEFRKLSQTLKHYRRDLKDKNPEMTDSQLDSAVSNYMNELLPEGTKLIDSFEHVQGKKAKSRVTKNKRAAYRERKWQEKLARRSDTFKRLSTELFSLGVVAAFDLEWHEHSKKLTEVGVTKFNTNTLELESYHFIISETYNLRNKTFVPDNKDRFDFGTSMKMSLDEVEQEVVKLFSDVKGIVGHDLSNDLFFLGQCGLNAAMRTFDTQKLGNLFMEEKRAMNLEKLATFCGMTTSNLHNAGNDSYYTMACMLHMLSA